MHIMNTISIFAFMAFFTLASAVLMKPMRFADYEQSIGLHRRAMNAMDGFAELVLQNHSQLIYHGVSSITSYTPTTWLFADCHQLLASIISPI